MDTNTTGWITLATLVAGFLFQWFRENRQRRWDIEDRAQAVTKTTKKLDAATSQLNEAIEVNTLISQKAFKEANNVNARLSDLEVQKKRKGTERTRRDDDCSEWSPVQSASRGNDTKDK